MKISGILMNLKVSKQLKSLLHISKICGELKKEIWIFFNYKNVVKEFYEIYFTIELRNPPINLGNFIGTIQYKMIFVII